MAVLGSSEELRNQARRSPALTNGDGRMSYWVWRQRARWLRGRRTALLKRHSSSGSACAGENLDVRWHPDNCRASCLWWAVKECMWGGGGGGAARTKRARGSASSQKRPARSPKAAGAVHHGRSTRLRSATAGSMRSPLDLVRLGDVGAGALGGHGLAERNGGRGVERVHRIAVHHAVVAHHPLRNGKRGADRAVCRGRQSERHVRAAVLCRLHQTCLLLLLPEEELLCMRAHLRRRARAHVLGDGLDVLPTVSLHRLHK
mmetsp:Transcript_44620/g.104227  ORF Transcript_44620/g.104227 Transcript_44620/m.104227 type:complete len:260 (-) Transcript_44620:495-1274(-)